MLDEKNPRLICYRAEAEGEVLTVFIHAGTEPVQLTQKGKPIFARKMRGRTLMGGGIAIYRQA